MPLAMTGILSWTIKWPLSLEAFPMELKNKNILHCIYYFVGKSVEEYRGKLGLFGVSGELGMRPLASLSGGQKSRVAFAQMAMVK